MGCDDEHLHKETSLNWKKESSQQDHLEICISISLKSSYTGTWYNQIRNALFFCWAYSKCFHTFPLLVFVKTLLILKVNCSHLLSRRAHVNRSLQLFSQPYSNNALCIASIIALFRRKQRNITVLWRSDGYLPISNTLWQNVTMSRKPTRHSVIIRLHRWSKPLHVTAVHQKYHIRLPPASKYHVPPSPLWCFCLFMTACAACSGTRAGSERILVVVLRCRIASETTDNKIINFF